MREIKSYLQAASQRGEKFNNSIGGFKNAAGLVGAPSRNAMWKGATGSTAPASMGSAPTSKPFIITVTAASTVLQTNITLFFANSAIYGYVYASDAAALANASGPGFFAGAYYPAAGIKVTTSFATYQQLLVQSQSKPFQIGKTMYLASSGANTTGQVNTPINFQQQYANGSQFVEPLIFVYDPNQQVNTQTINTESYTIDGNAGLVFTQLAAGSTGAVTNIYLYPTLTADISNALDGQNGINTYSAPPSTSTVRVING